MKTDFTGFVLAGGKSSRMGTEKSALELAGETFLNRAARVLLPNCDAVRVVLNRAQNFESEFSVVRDVFEARGALGGIHAALTNCPTKFAVVLAVDLPFVSSDAIGNLIDSARASNRYIAFVPRQSDGRAQPLCAVYRARYCLPPLEKLLRESDSASARDFLESIAPKYIEQSRLSADESLLFNVNHPADYERIK